MAFQIVLGLLMTAFTVGLGVIIVVFAAEVLLRNRAFLIDAGRFVHHVMTLSLIATWLVIGIFVISYVWALLLLGLDVFSTFEAALYFSMISFTTVGYGDLVPPEDWRMLAAFISVDGFLLFGLNTAFLFEALRRMRDDER